MDRIRPTLIATTAWLAIGAAAPAADHVVLARGDLTFSPANLTIQVGDTVTWTNEAGLHNVREDNDRFRCAFGCDGQGGNGNPSSGAWSFTLTFDTPETLRYYCEVHGAPGGVGMSGTVTVEEGAEPPPPPPPPPPASTEFDSGFEVEDFGDWDDHVCPACNLLSGSLAQGEAVFPQSSATTVREGGTLRALLRGPQDADFDLLLWWWTGSEWVEVAAGRTSAPWERVSFSGPAGRYRWEVRAAAGAGDFDLLLDNQGFEADHVNRLLQTRAARKRGMLGLEAVYSDHSRHTDFLVHELDSEARAYTTSFQIRALDDLAVKGRKHQILQLRQRGKAVARIHLFPPESGDDRPRLAVRVKSDSGAWSDPATTFLTPGRWQKLALEWQAASGPGVGDGSLRLRQGRSAVVEMLGLDNDTHRVDQVRLGFLTRGRKKTSGTLHVDNFASDWEN